MDKRSTSKILSRILQGLMCLLASVIAGCNLAPRYVPPKGPVVPQYRETGLWVKANPSVATLGQKKPWWTVFHDPTLNRLERQLSHHNNNIKIAYARFAEARELAKIARSYLYPNVQGFFNATKVQNSQNSLNNKTLTKLLYNNFLMAGLVSYEVDVWGKVRNGVKANEAYAAATQCDMVAMSLSLHTELAVEYYELRNADRVYVLLQRAVHNYQRSLRLFQNQHREGLVPEAVVDQATALYEDAKTRLSENRLQRAQWEHAIAVLIGVPPANLKISIQQTDFHRVTIGPELPSTLLERRPDVAAAELRVQSANANIGIARAAYFPAFNLFATLGGQSSQLPELFSTNSIYWAIGPTAGTAIVSFVQPMITWTIFDGFRLQANLSKAKDAVYQSAAAYRQTVLNAYKEVEDRLVAVHRLDEELATQTLATQAAARALRQINLRLQGEVVTYIEVTPIENQALQEEIALATVKVRRQIASIELIKALGGGWSRCGAKHTCKV